MTIEKLFRAALAIALIVVFLSSMGLIIKSSFCILAHVWCS